MKKLFVYDGPVTRFGNIVTNRWHGSTLAVSEKQARQNLAYHFKMQFGFTANAKVELVGSLVES